MSELKYGPRTKHVAALLERVETADLADADADAALDAALAARDAALDAELDAAWCAVWDAVWNARDVRDAVWDAVLDAVLDAALLARICVVWDSLTTKQMTLVLAWLDPVAKALDKTPETLMTMGDAE